MPNAWFKFKQFTVQQDKCAMKVGTDGVLLGTWVNVVNANSILDIGSGTGLIALMLAQRTDVCIDAVEIDLNACTQSMENVINSPWPKQISVYHNSLQQFVNHTNKIYDLIVSNPPYFNNSLKAPDKQRSLARHSDELSYSDLLSCVSKLLSENGNFCIILPYVEAQLFIVDAALYHLYCNIKVNIRPSVTKKVNRVLMQFSKKREKLEEKELVIRDVENNYSPEYIELTKEYYLNG